MTLLEELYEEYELIYGRQSVCNHHEMECIIASAKETVEGQDIIPASDEDFEDEVIEEALWLMAARVGQPIGKADKRVIDYYRLPWGDAINVISFPEGSV